MSRPPSFFFILLNLLPRFSAEERALLTDENKVDLGEKQQRRVIHSSGEQDPKAAAADKV